MNGDTRQHAHELIDQLPETQLSGFAHFLETIIEPVSYALTNAPLVTTDELPGVKPPKVERVDDYSEARTQWKRFQTIPILPERDQKAVVRRINSLVAAVPLNRNGAHGERNAR